MSAQQLTFDQALVKIADLEKSLNEIKTHDAAKYKGEEKEDKEMEASFKKAKAEMEHDDKEHKATEDDNEKVKDAFKKAEDESDPEKKKEAMKKAMEMKDDHDKNHAKKGETDPKDEPTTNVDKENHAKIASIVMKKIPLMQQILEATKIMDATNYDKVEKQLEAATLEQVQERYDTLAPYMAVIGAGQKSSASAGQMGLVPFQASAVINSDNPTDIFSASVDQIDFTKVSTKQIMEMYK